MEYARYARVNDEVRDQIVHEWRVANNLDEPERAAKKQKRQQSQLIFQFVISVFVIYACTRYRVIKGAYAHRIQQKILKNTKERTAVSIKFFCMKT